MSAFLGTRQVQKIGAKDPFVRIQLAEKAKSCFRYSATIAGRPPGALLRGNITEHHRLHASSNPPQKNQEPKMPSTSLVMKYTKVIPEAFPPTKGSIKAAGYDLKSAFDCVVPGRGKALVDTGLKVELPEGCYGRIAPRSGLAVKNFIDVGAGVVDEDYRGVIKVVLFNHSDVPFEVKRGDRIAQFICERIYYPDLQEVEDLTETERGEGGFGSTGTK